MQTNKSISLIDKTVRMFMNVGVIAVLCLVIWPILFIKVVEYTTAKGIILWQFEGVILLFALWSFVTAYGLRVQKLLIYQFAMLILLINVPLELFLLINCYNTWRTLLIIPLFIVFLCTLFILAHMLVSRRLRAILHG